MQRMRTRDYAHLLPPPWGDRTFASSCYLSRRQPDYPTAGVPAAVVMCE